MTFLVTGAAGFIGFHTCLKLIERGENVIGIDNLNSYYSKKLKTDRLSILSQHKNFSFAQMDLSDLPALRSGLNSFRIKKIIHLAAQAGVRYSIENPHAYISANIQGHLNVLEYCRNLGSLEALTYASSSSVYGGNVKLPFSEFDPVDTPVSLYAATKKADELMSYVYAHLYEIPSTGLRFFTVYGPWGRPDMAMWLFCEAILAGREIKVFNYGAMERDFTFVDDIVSGAIAVTDSPAKPVNNNPAHRVYNIGNNRPEKLTYMIEILEKALGVEAKKMLLPLQPGDVPATYADITAIQRDHGFEPTTPIEIGIPRFVQWFKEYHNC